MAQRRATKWVTGQYHNTSSVSDMLLIDWRSLEQKEWIPDLPSSIKYETTLLQLMRIIIFREALEDESTNIASVALWSIYLSTHSFC